MLSPYYLAFIGFGVLVVLLALLANVALFVYIARARGLRAAASAFGAAAVSGGGAHHHRAPSPSLIQGVDAMEVGTNPANGAPTVGGVDIYGNASGFDMMGRD